LAETNPPEINAMTTIKSQLKNALEIHTSLQNGGCTVAGFSEVLNRSIELTNKAVALLDAGHDLSELKADAMALRNSFGFLPSQAHSLTDHSLTTKANNTMVDIKNLICFGKIL